MGTNDPVRVTANLVVTREPTPSENYGSLEAVLRSVGSSLEGWELSILQAGSDIQPELLQLKNGMIVGVTLEFTSEEAS